MARHENLSVTTLTGETAKFKQIEVGGDPLNGTAGNALSGTELAYVDGITPGTATASKAVVLGTSKEIATLGSTTATSFTALTDDATNNGVTDVLTLKHSTSGSPAAGIGVGISLQIEDAGGVEEQASIDAVAQVVTNGQEDVDIVVSTNVAGTITEMLRIKADETGSGGAKLVQIGADTNQVSLDLHPGTTASGTLRITAADSAGDTVTTVTNASQAGARTYTIPDAGASASFVMTEGAQTINGVKTFGSEFATALGVGAKNGATVAAAETVPVVHKTVLTCTATPLTFGDEAGQGQYGGVKVYDFPAGDIVFLGAVIDGALTLTAPAIDTWEGDVGLGVEAPTDHQDVANKTGYLMTKQDIAAAVAKVASVDSASTATVITESGARWISAGTGTAADLFFNILIDDNGAHDNTITGTFTGTITFTWLNLGDFS